MPEIRTILRHTYSHPYAPLLALLGAAALIGLPLVDAYGQSWDEFANYSYGEKALNAYTDGTFLQDQEETYFHGTFYFMIFSVTSRLFSDLYAPWALVDGRHLTNYLTFLASGIALYALALRLMRPRWALATTALFITQPLYFGHAFINQKDTPLMAFFLFSLATGLAAADRWTRPSPTVKNTSSGFVASVRDSWRGTSHLGKMGLLISFLLGGFLLYDLYARAALYPWLQDLVHSAYAGRAHPLVNAAFQYVAPRADQAPVDGYLEKLRVAYMLLRVPLTALVLSIPFGVMAKVFSPTYRGYLRDPLMRYSAWLAAGVVLGMTTSIRVIGPFAGVLVALYALWKGGRRAVPPLIFYALTGMATTYLTWPTLWGDPVGRLLSRFSTATNFKPNLVLFEGQYFPSDQLPWTYLPKLIALQFTEPVLLFAFLGLMAVVITSIHRRGKRELVAVILVWFTLPIGAQILFSTSIYDNFRHLLFATPPLILLAGYGLMRTSDRIQPKGASAIIVLAALLTGIIHIANYHPYEYIYYNQLVGGVDGADGRYELDYWCTAYRDAMAYVNAHAPSGARITALGPQAVAREFAREDLEVFGEEVIEGQPAFALVCTRVLEGVPYYPDWEVVHVVGRGRAAFALVKIPPPD
jgi:hypothetical protein